MHRSPLHHPRQLDSVDLTDPQDDALLLDGVTRMVEDAATTVGASMTAAMAALQARELSAVDTACLPRASRRIVPASGATSGERRAA